MRPIPVENRFRVEADDRRGLVLLEKGPDGAIHLIWKDRQTLQVVDDLLVFPGDQTLDRVDTGRPEDRIYLLTFQTSATRRFFFWMQEPDASKDEERVKEFNRLMNEVGPVAGAGGLRGVLPPPISGTSSATAAPIVGLDELSNILSGLGYSPTTTTDTSPAATSETSPPSAEDTVAPSADSSMDVEEEAAAGDVPQEPKPDAEKKEDGEN